MSEELDLLIKEYQEKYDRLGKEYDQVARILLALLRTKNLLLKEGK